jgi:hypothetical protein
VFDGFFKFPFTSRFSILPNANPGRYFSQYNIIVTDVCDEWKRESTRYRTLIEISTTGCILDEVVLSADTAIHIQMNIQQNYWT